MYDISRSHIINTVFDGKRMGATHIGRSCSVEEFAGVVNSVVGVLTLEAFLINGFKKTRDDGGLLLRSHGRCGVLKTAWSLLWALLGHVGVSRFSKNRRRRVSCSIVGRMLCLERKSSIFECIKRSCNFAVGGDKVHHVLGWFDTMGGWVGGLSRRQMG
jgi:hypothetical protein